MGASYPKLVAACHTMEDSALPPLLGILGHRIAGNPMQFAMERVLEAAGLDWRFLSFDVVPERLEVALVGLEALGFQGLAIATPHARQIGQWLPHTDPDAVASGWVDTISRHQDGSWVGYHLTGRKFREWLGTEPIEGATALVLGAPDETAKGLAIAELLKHHGLAAIEREVDDLEHVQILLRGNTAAGQPVSFSEADVERLPENAVVVDLATAAGTSPLLRFSAARGLRTLSSIDLMELRSAAAFEIWTGHQPDRTLLREAFEEYLEI